MSTAKGYVRLDRALLRSPEYEALSNHAKVLLTDLIYCHTGKNNGAIRYGIAQAGRLLRCHKRTAIRVFKELQDAQFIEATERGSFAFKAGARAGAATAWRIAFLK